MENEPGVPKEGFKRVVFCHTLRLENELETEIVSMLGGIMLIGIVVKNGIVLIDYILLCRERGMGIIRSVITAGRSRLRPVLMTTLTTILGMVPMAVGQGVGAEMWRPLGVAVIGGLTVSTILTLILVPVAYCMFAGNGVFDLGEHKTGDLECNATGTIQWNNATLTLTLYENGQPAELEPITFQLKKG